MYKIDLTDVWELADKVATERHVQKKNYKTSLVLSPNYEIVGILGELLFSMVINQEANLDLIASGDGGYDFNNVNVKSSEEYKAKHLIEFSDKKFNGYYVFVIINLEEKYGYIKGYIHSKEFQDKSETRNFGYGDRKCLDLEDLNEYSPKKPVKLKPVHI